jgi:hypothetical protein
MIVAAAIVAASLVVTARTAWRPVAATATQAVAGTAQVPATEGGAWNGNPGPQAAAPASASEPASDGTSPAGDAAPASGDDDLMTFAYVSTDLAVLQAGLAHTVNDAEALTSAADSWSLSQVRTSGEQLLTHARALAESAGRATTRIQELAPDSDTLSRVRQDALSVYALTADQAYTAISLAEFAISLDVSQATTVAENIAALQRGGDGLTASFATIGATLEQWAAANPSAAQTALSQHS